MALRDAIEDVIEARAGELRQGGVEVWTDCPADLPGVHFTGPHGDGRIVLRRLDTQITATTAGEPACFARWSGGAPVEPFAAEVVAEAVRRARG